MGIEKDKGYAWVVVAASSFLMFVGPSAYSSYGLLFMEVDLRTYQTWIINSMCSLWFGTALLAGPMAAVTTHRKIAMIGCFMATVGLLMASATLDNPVWLFLSFSILVGVGLGLAINVTFLVVAAHFEKYRGLANGISQISLSIGYLTTPFLYSIIDGPKDKLHIRALLTAVAFLSATFYMGPAPKSRSTSPKLINGSRSSSQRSSGNPEQLSPCDSFEDIPLVELKEENSSNENSNSNQKPRRRSQYLLAISASLLPKIPEESENNSLSEISGTIEISPPSNGNLIENFENSTSPPTQSVNVQETTQLDGATNGINGSISVNPATHQANKKIRKVANPISRNCNGQKSSLVKRVYRIRTAKAAKQYSRDTDDELGDDNKNNNNSSTISRWMSRFKILKFGCAVISQIEFNLFTNLKFLNMALGSAFTLIAIPNFPVILCSYISLIPLEDKEEGMEVALLIIFSLDMVSRLIFSYLSDFSFFNRRIGFFCGTVCCTLSIIGIGFITDLNMIYCMCAIYGICTGILLATESLMFVDIFGIEKLPSTYGIVNLFKCLGIIVITPLLGSPASAYIYTTHPFSYMLDNNSTISCQDCDPLGLFEYEDIEAAIQRRQNMLCIVATPGIVCSLLWTLEAMWIRTAKPHRLQRSAFSENSENLRAQV